MVNKSNQFADMGKARRKYFSTVRKWHCAAGTILKAETFYLFQESVRGKLFTFALPASIKN